MKTQRLKIGSNVWTIRFQPKVVDDNGEELNGLTLHDEREILIDSRLTKDQRQLIIFHEVLHATLFETGLNELISIKMEEAIVRGLSNTLCPLVRSAKFLK
jgi:Zn-dependent peptidase ImmA (M78 family)